MIDELKIICVAFVVVFLIAYPMMKQKATGKSFGLFKR